MWSQDFGRKRPEVYEPEGAKTPAQMYAKRKLKDSRERFSDQELRDLSPGFTGTLLGWLQEGNRIVNGVYNSEPLKESDPLKNKMDRRAEKLRQEALEAQKVAEADLIRAKENKEKEQQAAQAAHQLQYEANAKEAEALVKLQGQLERMELEKVKLDEEAARLRKAKEEKEGKAPETPRTGDKSGADAAEPSSGGAIGAVKRMKQEIRVNDKGLTALPEDTEHTKVSSIGVLNVADNATLTSLDGIAKFESLEKLDASSCGLTVLPEEVGKCEELEELLVYGNKIKDLPASLGALAALATLNLFNNQLKKVPEDLGKLSKLEEVNIAANKLMMTSDALFASWGSVKVLSLYDNNLVRMGSLAPLKSLEELRLSNNNLEEMPALGPAHPALKVIELSRNRVAKIPDEYFASTPALERLNISGNMLEAIPASLLQLTALLGVQLQENKLAFNEIQLKLFSLPASLETLFLQKNEPLTALPPALAACPKLKRVNLTALKLDEASSAIAETIKTKVLELPDGIFWGQDGIAHPLKS